MTYNMTVYFTDGEIDNYKVQFEGHDMEALIIPDVNILVFASEEGTVSLPLRNIKKIEHKEQDEDR